MSVVLIAGGILIGAAFGFQIGGVGGAILGAALRWVAGLRIFESRHEILVGGMTIVIWIVVIATIIGFFALIISPWGLKIEGVRTGIA